MELWEFNACVVAYNKKEKAALDRVTAASWQTGNFTGAAFAGKLKGLKSYLYLQEEATAGDSTDIPPEKMAAIDKAAKELRERMVHDGLSRNVSS